MFTYKRIIQHEQHVRAGGMATDGNDGKKALARVVLLTRDEYDLIADFLEYYGRVVGRGNVVVIDNGSVDPRVLAEYDRHVSLGGPAPIVERRPFSDAVSFMSEHLAALAPTCRWLLPMETDEFVYAAEEEDEEDRRPCPRVVFPEAVRDALRLELEGASSDVGVLRYFRVLRSLVDPSDPGYEHGAYTRPAVQMSRFGLQGWDKLIVRSDAFVRMSQWCHHAVLRVGFRESTSGVLGVLHFHDTGARRLVERAIPVAKAYGYLDMSHGSLEEKLDRAREISRARVTCGHKVEILQRHLVRLAILRAFSTWVGRLPTRDEMDEFAPQSDPFAAVRTAAAGGLLRSFAAPPNDPVETTRDDLLYDDARQQVEAPDTERRLRVDLSRTTAFGFVCSSSTSR